MPKAGRLRPGARDRHGIQHEAGRLTSIVGTGNDIGDLVGRDVASRSLGTSQASQVLVHALVKVDASHAPVDMTSVHESPFADAQSPLHVEIIAIGPRCACNVVVAFRHERRAAAVSSDMTRCGTLKR